MYYWRTLTPDQQEFILSLRKKEHRPWHCPQHDDWGERAYHVTAACYEHQAIIGSSPDRLMHFESDLLSLVSDHLQNVVSSWCILPNHYHLLLESRDIRGPLKDLGEFHGRTSFEWNGADKQRGRKVWHGSAERAIRSERHFWTTTNYIHHNPVRHGYVRKWQEWPFSSAGHFLEQVGRENALRIWREYPLLDYGKGWDAPSL